MKTNFEKIWAGRIRVILTFILIILYIALVIHISGGPEGLFVDLVGAIFLAVPFIIVFMGICDDE